MHLLYSHWAARIRQMVLGQSTYPIRSHDEMWGFPEMGLPMVSPMGFSLTIHLGGSPWLRKPSCPHRMAPKMCKITYKSPTQCGFCGVFNSRGKGNLDPWQKPAKAEKVIWVRTRIAGHITHCVIAGNSRTSRNFPFWLLWGWNSLQISIVKYVHKESTPSSLWKIIQSAENHPIRLFVFSHRVPPKILPLTFFPNEDWTHFR